MQPLLAALFSRHPSALARASGEDYRVICRCCGSFVALPPPHPLATSLTIACALCGEQERIEAPTGLRPRLLPGSALVDTGLPSSSARDTGAARRR